MGDPTMCRVSDDAMTMRMQFSLARCARRNIRSATVTDRQRLSSLYTSMKGSSSMSTFVDTTRTWFLLLQICLPVNPI